MRKLFYHLLFCFLISSTYAEKMDLSYKLEKGDVLIYRKSSKSKHIWKKSLEAEEWKEHESETKEEDFSVRVKDVFEKADGETVYLLEFDAKVPLDKTIFRAAMTPKGKFLFYGEEDRKAFLSSFGTVGRSLYAGLAFPKLPNEKVRAGDEYRSPDLIMAYHRDYNLVFSGKNVFVNTLKIKKSNKGYRYLILEGSNKGKFTDHSTQYDYYMSKSYNFDTEKRIVTYGMFREKKDMKGVIPNTEEPPRCSDITWEVKLISINGKKLE